MEGGEALTRLARWLIGQNSMAARLLTEHPKLIVRLGEGISPGRLNQPPSLANGLEEEEALAAVRIWWAEGLLSLSLAALNGRPGPLSLTARLSSQTGRLVEHSLVMADRYLRERYFHPLLLPEEEGPGPLIVLGLDELSGGELVFDQPVNLLFLFARRQPYAGAQREERLNLALAGSRDLIIFKEYVLKTAQRVIGYLTMQHPDGPGLKLTAPAGAPPGLLGPQLTSLSDFLDFFRHQAAPAQLMTLARITPVAGQARLARDVCRLARQILANAKWDQEVLAGAIASLTPAPAEEFDPLTGPGGLRLLNFVVDGLLLLGGVLPSGDTGARLKKAVKLDLLSAAQAKELSLAHSSLLRAHLCLSLLGRNLPGHNLVTAADLDAALALWPSPPKTPELLLDQAQEIVLKAQSRLGLS